MPGAKVHLGDLNVSWRRITATEAVQDNDIFSAAQRCETSARVDIRVEGTTEGFACVWAGSGSGDQGVLVVGCLTDVGC